MTPEELNEGIEIVSPALVHIDRELLTKILDNSGKLIGIAAAAPKMEDGKAVGLEVQGIRPKTLLHRLGIQHKDILENIDGKPIVGADAALNAYTLLRTANKFSLAVKRRGQTFNINYNVD